VDGAGVVSDVQAVSAIDKMINKMPSFDKMFWILFPRVYIDGYLRWY
jgi:hypothetical protein